MQYEKKNHKGEKWHVATDTEIADVRREFLGCISLVSHVLLLLALPLEPGNVQLIG